MRDRKGTPYHSRPNLAHSTRAFPFAPIWLAIVRFGICKTIADQRRGCLLDSNDELLKRIMAYGIATLVIIVMIACLLVSAIMDLRRAKKIERIIETERAKSQLQEMAHE